MKIGVITFHQALNYGAILQAYALQSFINENYTNAAAELVDYRSPYLSRLYSVKSKNSKNPIYGSIRKAHFLLKKRFFQSFIKKNINISKPYTPYTIENANSTYDKFIVGSDQVWNCNLTDCDKNYLLAFSQPDKRYSYAASIGISEIPLNVINEYVKELSCFRKISVRENQAIDTLHNIGLTSIQIQQHIDPVLLLPLDKWNRLCYQTKNIKSDYVLIFSVEYSNELIEEAVAFAKSKNMEVYYIGQRTKNADVKYFPLISIGNLLSLFRDAKYVFANSFHGTAFSIIFHKKFYVRMAHRDGRNSRIVNLLNQLSLSDKTCIETIDIESDWHHVDKVLDLERSRSKEYISGIIENED